MCLDFLSRSEDILGLDFGKPYSRFENLFRMVVRVSQIGRGQIVDDVAGVIREVGSCFLEDVEVF